MACSSKPRARENEIVVHAVQEIERLQDEIVGRHVLRMLPHGPHQLPFADLWRNRSDDADGDAILQGEQIVEVAVILIGTNDIARFGVAELGSNPEAAS